MAAMMRQICKQILTMAGAVLLLLAVAAPVHAQSLVTRIVTDPLTGVAIDGYDPVSYFTDPEPVTGSPEFEYYWGGVPWYFASAANRDVFMRAPDVYAPQHGGYCEMSLARGYLSDGKPRIYVIEQMKLYLFYSAANREAFILSPDEALARAGENWPTLSSQLQGPPLDVPITEPPDAAETPEAETGTAEHP
jgi:YHS domain-containing protein